MAFHGDLNLEATELRLGLPGTGDHERRTPPVGVGVTKNNKRGLPELEDGHREESTRTTKTQVVGWPPVRSYRKNCLQPKKTESESGGGVYVKVSMDGVPYLRKIDLKLYKEYPQLLKDLEEMFKLKGGEYSEREGYSRSEFMPAYEDKDGDWMLVGDVPWNMFVTSCKRLRIMKGSEL
ncbi:hypothetical protein SAY86_015176 [Trapa natans]|uniref:Auxin-responsive protein n=1 Tax=Trapa natans TaxID=22666 RepID=A0AAN7KHS3_TRANT|nr:hypothetical protein SAY86_015176 [Trapa natans]